MKQRYLSSKDLDFTTRPRAAAVALSNPLLRRVLLLLVTLNGSFLLAEFAAPLLVPATCS
jgi:hypothetical protein